MPRWKGESFRSNGCSPEHYYSKKTGEEAPPEAYEHFARRWMRRVGIKPAGRRKMESGQTLDELRLEQVESGKVSEEQLADREGIDLESLRKSLRRGRRRRDPAMV